MVYLFAVCYVIVGVVITDLCSQLIVTPKLDPFSRVFISLLWPVTICVAITAYIEGFIERRKSR